MEVNKVIFFGKTLIDTTGATVKPETLFRGETALGADGEMKIGTFTIDPELAEQISLIEQIKIALRGKTMGDDAEGGYADGYADGYEAGSTEGYAKGHADGYSKGHAEGMEKGYADGLAERTYETWTITLTDGTVVEKEVALL